MDCQTLTHQARGRQGHRPFHTPFRVPQGHMGFPDLTRVYSISLYFSLLQFRELINWTF